jgi:predicted AAA+ superfamily ATPase
MSITSFACDTIETEQIRDYREKIGRRMYIKREVYKKLLQWKADKRHTTLEVNGARQVGKTFIIDKFAEDNFKHTTYINLFELSGSQFMACYKAATQWQPGQGARPKSPLHDALKMFDADFSDDEDTIVIIDEIQESAEIYNRIREFTRQFRCRFIHCHLWSSFRLWIIHCIKSI